jgi:hypothetical protein
MKHRPFLIALYSTSLYLGAPATQTAAADFSGHIEAFNCDPKAYELTRADKVQSPVQFLTRLYPNDLLSLTQRNCQMTLRIGEVNIIQLNDGRLHYVVPAAGHYPTLSSNLLSLLQDGLHYLLYGEATTPQPHTVITRGNENKVKNLVLPQMQEEQAQLVAGDRDLLLMWEGGQSPYRVRLYLGDSKKPQLERTGLPNRQVRFEKLHLTVGQQYRVQVRSMAPQCPQQSDDEPCLTEKQFQVVDAKQLPAMPAELAQSSLSADLKQTLFAVWLLDPKNKFKITWGLEAYQRVAAGKDEFSAWVATNGKW